MTWCWILSATWEQVVRGRIDPLVTASILPSSYPPRYLDNTPEKPAESYFCWTAQGPWEAHQSSKRATLSKNCLAKLSPEDQFGIVAFDNQRGAVPSSDAFPRAATTWKKQVRF